MCSLKKILLCTGLISALFFTGCASKRPTTQAGNEGQPPTVSTVPSAKPNESPPTISGTPIPPPEPPKASSESPRVTLVLGGAGVASFATVGLLKRFREEGIEVDAIITTGWPTLFVLANGFLKSVHDLEWFATKLQEKDFYKAGIFDASKGYAGHEKLSSLVEGSFKQQDLGESKVPIIISAANTDADGTDIYDRGEWRTPLLKTMSIPGIFRPYPHGKDADWINSLQGMDVDEAKRRGAKTIVALEMYGDYFDFLKAGKRDSSDSVFRRLYLASLKRSIARELKDANITGKILLNASPTDFEQKRLAIFSGYKEGARLAKLIRSAQNH